MPYGTSWDIGKQEVKNFLLKKLPTNAKICDVGAGGGTYYNLLGPNFEWTAIEIFHETVIYLKNFYNKVYEADIRTFEYPEYYDLIIFGDVLEHITIEEAQECLKKAKLYTNAILVAVPYGLEQKEQYGNKAEIHIQYDLTPELFDERYPGFTPIF